jgi:MFS family permease
MFLAFYILLTALPLYLVGTLHAGTDKVGLVVTLFFLAGIIVRPFVGQWVIKYSLKGILIYSAIGFFGATMLYPFIINIWALLILRIFHGITFGIISTIQSTICAEVIPISRLGEGVSYFSMAMSLAMVFGPFIALNLANMNAYHAAFVICIIISAVNIVLATQIKIPKKEVSIHPSGKVLSFNDLFEKKAAPFALATFILACAYSGVSTFLALYAKELGLAKSASYFFIVYAVSILISRPFTGRWSDQFGTKVIVYPSLILFAVGMFLLSQAHTSAILLIAGAVIGLGYGSLMPLFQAQTINSVERHRVITANSLFFNSMDGGMAMGSYAFGIVASVAGYSSIYEAGVVLIVIAGLQYFALTQKKIVEQASSI